MMLNRSKQFLSAAAVTAGLLLAHASPVLAVDIKTYSGVQGSIEKYLCAPTAPGQPVAGQGNRGNAFFGNTGAPTTTVSSNSSGDLFNCINKLYRFAIVVAVTVAMLFVALAGYLYMAADGNAEQTGKAKTYILNVVVALLILLGGNLLLKTINPDLIQFRPVNSRVAFDPLPSQELNNQTATNWTPTTGVVAGTKSGPSTALQGGMYRFSQCDQPWGSQQYGSCQPANQSTICTSACGPSSLAAVAKYWIDKGMARATGQAPANPNPGNLSQLSVQLGDRVCGNGTSYAFISQVAPMYGLKVRQVPWSAALDALKQGKTVIGAMGPGTFTSGGHYVAFYGVDGNGNVLSADSGPRNIQSASPATIGAEGKTFWIISPS